VNCSCLKDGTFFMNDKSFAPPTKSPERAAFEYYLRTGRRLSPQGDPEVEVKFNPYHDPRNGRFTFAPGGPRSLSDIIISDGHRGERRVFRPSAKVEAQGPPVATDPAQPDLRVDAVYRPDEATGSIQPAQYRPRSRGGRGDNGGPPLNDPLTIEQTFPGLRNSPGGSLIALADNIFDLTGPARLTTTEVMGNHIANLIQQIKTIDPGFRLDLLAFPTTLEGQANLIRQLRFDRAAAFYRVKTEVGPLQVATLRLMQERADSAYQEGQALFNAGRLRPRLSREEAVGNYVDRMVRRELRDLYNAQGIDYSKGQKVRVIGREYDTSGTDATYRIPDARVGDTAFDVTLSRKTLVTPQVRGFFNSDFKPVAVVIIRPRQLGPNSTYAISSPRK